MCWDRHRGGRDSRRPTLRISRQLNGLGKEEEEEHCTLMTREETSSMLDCQPLISWRRIICTSCPICLLWSAIRINKGVECPSVRVHVRRAGERIEFKCGCHIQFSNCQIAEICCWRILRSAQSFLFLPWGLYTSDQGMLVDRGSWTMMLASAWQ